VEGATYPVIVGINNFIKDNSEHINVAWLHDMETGGIHNFIKNIVQNVEVEAVHSLVIGHNRFIYYILEQSSRGLHTLPIGKNISKIIIFNNDVGS
jgi:hypothetical protein